VKAAYVDTSCLLAVAFDEPAAKEWTPRLASYDVLVSANLTEAEFRAALHREDVDGADAFLDGVRWLLPDRPLGVEIDRVLRIRYLRGADLWHLACALFLAEEPRELDFLTLDANQEEAARALGFGVPGH
jgi:predicted nucleic acid-binding protein